MLGYLLAGIAIGPFGLGRLVATWPILGEVVIHDIEGVRDIAELGVVFLMFMVGLELSLSRLWTLRRFVLGLGGAQVAATAAVIATIAWAFGNQPAAAIVLGACLALSSTAMVVQILTEQRRLTSPTGQVALAILLMQDLAVIPILFLLGALAGQEAGQASLALGLAGAIAKAAVAVVIIVMSGRLVLKPLFRLVSAAGAPELFLAVALLVALGTALATAAAGLSMTLGAFLAGMVLSEGEHRHAVEVAIEPFKGLLLGLFFVAVGMGIDPAALAGEIAMLSLGVIGLLAIKAVILTGLCLAFRLPRSVAVETGLLLGQGGEFALVVVGAAMTQQLIEQGVGQFMMVLVALTMVLTPFGGIVARRLSLSLGRHEHGPVGTAAALDGRQLDGHVVIAGFGRVGQLVAGFAADRDLPYLALDQHGQTVAAARDRALPVFFGNAARNELLERLGAGRARALVVAVDDDKAAMRLVEGARRAWPDLPIFARARDAAHAGRLTRAGATAVVPETVEASLQLGRLVLEASGLGEDEIDRMVDDQRARALSALHQGE
jgi:CPA2 family monovalent cation:H+ antiporter-2